MKKLKSFNKIGAANNKGEVIIPAKYTDIERIDKYISPDATVSDHIYIAYKAPYYDLYTNQGKINCPFEIKYYCVKDNTLVGLLDTNGYWHVIAIDSDSLEVKPILENLSNIESFGYNHVVCRQTNDNQFVYSLSKNSIIYQPVFCKEINLYSQGFHIKKRGLDEICNYDGQKVLSGKGDLSIVPGIKINSKELFMSKNPDNLLLGLYSIDGNCILGTYHTEIKIHKHYYNNEKEYITLEVSNYTSKNHSLYQLLPSLKPVLLYPEFTSMELFDCGRVALIHTNLCDCLINFSAEKELLRYIEIKKASTINALYPDSCRHFVIWERKKCGVCNLEGNMVIPLKYKQILVNEFQNKATAYGFLGNKSIFYLI